ncbi:unnamed protein product [Camellia sinensis]
MEGVPLGVRKGAWTEEEDNLLKKCIETNGEGKWHQVPFKAGLNRCRKSCRLRWLNYLRPNIKRGSFGIDEVDLIIRLHKLLGNRWSLIAGRLPGRTANDVKNYWNTHLQKKLMPQIEVVKVKTPRMMETKAIRPRPRTFSKNLIWLKSKTTAIANIETRNNLFKQLSPPLSPPRDDGISWWENMFVDLEINKEITLSIDGSNEEKWHEKETQGILAIVDSSVQGESDWNDIFIDKMDLWDL